MSELEALERQDSGNRSEPTANTAARQELVEAILLAQARGMDEPASRELFARDGLTWREKLAALRAPGGTP